MTVFVITELFDIRVAMDIRYMFLNIGTLHHRNSRVVHVVVVR